MSENEGPKLKVMPIDDKLVSEHFGKLILELDKVTEQLGEIGKDIYEKINMTGNSIYSVPAMLVLNHRITLDQKEFNMKAEMLIAQYNRIVSEILQLNYMNDFALGKDTDGEDALSSHLKQAADFREKRLAELQNQLQVLKDAWAKLNSHIVDCTRTMPGAIVPITRIHAMPCLVVPSYSLR